MTKIIFFGTPNFVLPVLTTINANFDLVAIVTQPDKPQGRKHILTPSPVKQFALQGHIPVFDPAQLTPEFTASLPQADLAVLAAYGKIIKPDLLAHPQYGFLNIHPSLLPLYRGATPTLGPILRGETTTGITYMLMDPLMDHGPIIHQFETQINPEHNRNQLTSELFIQASHKLPDVIREFLNHPSQITLQDHTKATFSPILNKQDGFVPWDAFAKSMQTDDIDLSSFSPKIQDLISDIYTPYLGATFFHRACLALSPWPGLWTITPGSRRLKILTSHLHNDQFYPQLIQIEGSTPVDWKKFKTLHQIIQLQNSPK